jgi:hypothetical protein
MQDHSEFCVFDADTLRCSRCGFKAKRLPTFRSCRTILEMASDVVKKNSTERITVPSLRLGDAAASTLAVVGINPERIKKWTGAKECGCEARKRALNAVGNAVSRLIQNSANAVLNATIPHPMEGQDVAAIANSLILNPSVNQGLKDKAAGK